LELLVRGLQLLHRGLELLVRGLQLLHRGLELLEGGLALLSGSVELFLGPSLGRHVLERHGYALGLAALYPTWVATTAADSPEVFDAIRRAMDRGSGMPTSAIQDALVEFMARIELTPTLTDLGADASLCEKMAEMVSGSLASDPWWRDGRDLLPLYLGSLEAQH